MDDRVGGPAIMRSVSISSKPGPYKAMNLLPRSTRQEYVDDNRHDSCTPGAVGLWGEGGVGSQGPGSRQVPGGTRSLVLVTGARRTRPPSWYGSMAGAGQRLGRLNRIPGVFVKQMHARKKYRG